MNLRRTIKRKSKHRKKHVRRGKTMKKYRIGGDALKADEQNDAEAYKNIITDYITRQETNGKMNLEKVKYNLFKKKLADAKAITSKNASAITRDELDKLKSIVFFIIKDDVKANEMFFDEKSAGFQIWIDSFIKYLINDAPFEDAISMKLMEGIKKKPYIKMLYNKKYNHFISDVNNLFVNIKNELSNKKDNKVIKATELKINANVGPVP